MCVVVPKSGRLMPGPQSVSEDAGAAVGKGSLWQCVAILVWILSRNCSLAGLYVTTLKPNFFNNDGVLPDDVTLALVLLDWWRSHSTKVLVGEAVENMNASARVRADEFLIRSLVAEHIMRNNQRGESVMPAAIINKYCQLWFHRPICERVQNKLARLTWHFTDRKNFLRRFRREWGFRAGRIRSERVLSPVQIKESVFSVARLLDSVVLVVTK